MRNVLIGTLVLPLTLALAACGGEQEMEGTAGMTETADTAPVPPAVTDPGAGMGTDTGMGTGMGSTVNLQPLGGSGISGEATISEQGAQTQVMVRLAGGQPNTTHQGHIHRGTCESPGPAAAPLQPVTMDGQGSGTSTSTVQVSHSSLMDGQHIIAYHEAGGSPGRPVVCGAVQGHQM